MKNFTKSLLAVALLAAGTGAANASIATGTSAEAFLMVYDQTQGLTFSLDLGSAANLSALAGSRASQLVLNYNLGADANWTTFQSGLDAANTKFGVVVANGIRSLYTSATASVWDATTGIVSSGLTTTSGQVTAASSSELGEVGRLNTGMGTTVSQNLSKLVANANAAQGAWAASAGSTAILTNLWNAKGDANAAIGYDAAGAVANFFLTSGSTVTELGQWTLTNSTLSYAGAAPSAVPLPAAVWMFGAGLMGVLRLNRRKSAAV